ncbi:sialate O-acetylesterase-like [Mya arenaria]|uniref:sialate O-acetylesterase-like n=1 Tax=Mya arenaria TaxID=6604 RepID=UPI0022DFD160|nr:sialate O-acetylesterase-like [Mya arenaria]
MHLKLALLSIVFGFTRGELSLASYYGDHMVLQRAPKSTYIWGYADTLGSMVSVQVAGMTAVTTRVVRHDQLARNVWKVMLPPVTGPGPYQINITSSEGTLTMNDVMFGDVWLCSGQSNMQFTTSMVFNASEEVTDANNYPDIRLFTVALKWSNRTLYELTEVEQSWSRASNESVGHGAWSYFSAVCWLFGKRLYQHRKYPIGLIATTWGGTPVEAWSSQDAMNICEPEKAGLTDARTNQKPLDKRTNQTVSNGIFTGNEPAPQNTPTQLWKAMVHPMLNLTIYGAIWYQGEANAGAPELYKCRFPVMIFDWRAKFNEGSSGQTDPNFPFGFVQLASWRNDSTITKGFPDIRWRQTSDFGYVPNPQMPYTFMAVAMDLPDFTSPYNSIHPRDKQDIADRLLLSALPVAYNVTSLGRYQGPLVSKVTYSNASLMIEFDTQIEIRTKDGFEVCCATSKYSKCDGSDQAVWIAAPIMKSSPQSVTLLICNSSLGLTRGFRYAWRESPCAFKKCAIYSRPDMNSLPMGPYIKIELDPLKYLPHVY